MHTSQVVRHCEAPEEEAEGCEEDGAEGEPVVRGVFSLSAKYAWPELGVNVKPGEVNCTNGRQWHVGRE